MSKLLLIAIFILVVFLIVRWLGAQNNEFVANSAVISGVIISKEERTTRNDQPQRKQYVVSYSYRVDDKEYIGTDNFEISELWSEIKEGQTVDINYLKSDPAKSQLSMLLKYRAK
jgi:hypothetical protein